MDNNIQINQDLNTNEINNLDNSQNENNIESKENIELEKIKKELDAKNNEILSLKNDLNFYKEKNEELNQEIDKIKSLIINNDIQENEINNLKNEIEIRDNKIQEINEENNKLKNDINILTEFIVNSLSPLGISFPELSMINNNQFHKENEIDVNIDNKEKLNNEKINNDNYAIKNNFFNKNIDNNKNENIDNNIKETKENNYQNIDFNINNVNFESENTNSIGNKKEITVDKEIKNNINENNILKNKFEIKEEEKDVKEDDLKDLFDKKGDSNLNSIFETKEDNNTNKNENKIIEKKVTPPPPKKKQINPSSSNKNKIDNKTQLKNLSNRYPLNFMEIENQKVSENT